MIKRSLLLLLVAFVLPTAAQAATLTFGGPTTARVGQEFSVPVLLSTAESANAVSSTVTYPTDLLTLVSTSKDGSIISLWPSDPTTGNATVNFGGIILNPGWTGTRGTVLTLVFAAKAPGTADIEFESDASVLANDGSATEIISGTSPTSVVISAAPAAPAQPAKTTTTTSTKPGTAVTSTPVAATTTPTTTPTVAATEPTPTVPIAASQLQPTWYAFAHSATSVGMLWLFILLLLLFLAWHRYERGVPPFYFTFEGKARMTPPSPDVLLKQFDTLREAIKLEAISIQKVKEGQPLTEEEERFLTLFKKLMNVVEGPTQ